MKANKQKKIKVPKSGFKRSRFNWSHDVNTTFSWGEVQPTQCKLLIPGSKTSMQAQNLIRLAPMVAPTFGRVKYKTFNQFVGMSEIFPNFDAMMAQEPITRYGGTKVPQSMPWISLGILSQWVLHGARATLYFVDPSNPNPAQAAADGNYVTLYKNHNTTQWNLPTDSVSLLSDMVSAGVLTASTDPYGHSTYSYVPDVGTRFCLALNKVNLGIAALHATLGTGAPDMEVVLAANTVGDLVPAIRGYAPAISNAYTELKPEEMEVTFDSADYVIEGSFTEGSNTWYVAFAFELSDFGKRLRKIIQGCGYQINFASQAHVNMLPLLAQYKAYFDIFGLQLYHGWETTYCQYFINYFTEQFASNGDNQFFYNHNYTYLAPLSKAIAFFTNELGNEWYTEDPDFIGAHIERMSVSPNVDTTGFISVDSSGFSQNGANITEGDNTLTDGTVATQNEQNALSSPYPGIAFIDQVQHGQVDAELLKRIYKWTNRNTILGRKIAEILRAQGLGKYVEECKSNYIGATDNMITISDVVSQSDTFDSASDTGAVLGEYGGKGLQYMNDQTLVFENDEYGYWITLATVVPEAGYTQGLDPTLTAVKKFDLYHADFDAVGMEMTPRNAVVGSNYIVLDNATEPLGNDTGFGFIPKMSKFKVCQNLVNGDFNRHGLRSTYLPYTLDKQLNVNDYDVSREVYDTANGATFNAVHLNRSSRAAAMPVAGDVWRTPTKYPWMGKFDRIFYNVGEHELDSQSINQIFQNNIALVGFSDYNNDNFLSHAIYDVQSYAPMKPIEDSYGLDEDDPNGKAGSDFVTKA